VVKPKFEHIEIEQVIAALPNLDAFVTVNQAREAHEELQVLQRVIDTYVNYADAKQAAMDCRTCGVISSACAYEAAADDLYKQLPDWARSW